MLFPFSSQAPFVSVHLFEFPLKLVFLPFASGPGLREAEACRPARQATRSERRRGRMSKRAAAPGQRARNAAPPTASVSKTCFSFFLSCRKAFCPRPRPCLGAAPRAGPFRALKKVVARSFSPQERRRAEAPFVTVYLKRKVTLVISSPTRRPRRAGRRQVQAPRHGEKAPRRVSQQPHGPSRPARARPRRERQKIPTACHRQARGRGAAPRTATDAPASHTPRQFE